MNVAIAGASGFIGSALASALVDAGHTVTALTRQPGRYNGAGTPVMVDIDTPRTIGPALRDHDAAYYLVHSLAGSDFAERDRAGAHSFAEAAKNAGLSQIIYLGGLGEDGDDLSEHLRSRREVETILMGSVPTTALRAGIVIGDGGISWEILRQLVQRLPVMVTPRWVETRTQPIALADVLDDLTGVLGHPGTIGETFEIGGPTPLTYRTMMVTVGRLIGLNRTIIPVPFLSPRLSSHWLRLITDVDLTTAQALVDSMTNEVIVRDHRIETLLGHTRLSFEDAVLRALHQREVRLGVTTAVRADH